MNLKDLIYGIGIVYSIGMATSAYIPQVKARWVQTDTTKEDCIIGKPADSMFQSDYNCTNTSDYRFVWNKPKADWNETDTSKWNYIKNKPSNSDSVSFYSLSGKRNNKIKILIDTVTVTSALGFTVNYSSVGFAGIFSANAIAIKNTSIATSVPNIAIKNITTTSMDLNFTEGNASIISLLGSGVLLGPSTGFASTSGLKVAIVAFGY